ncbi:hypothetical protein Tco_0574643 [Tanacetum coccineum]
MSLRTTVHAQMTEITELQLADYSDIDCYADTTERDDSTSGTGHHTTGAGYCITRTTGTCWGPAQPELPEEAGSSS